MLNKVAIYDPYLDTLGGGERYCLTVAEILIKNNYEVHLYWSGNPDIIKKAEQRFSLNLKNIILEPDVFEIKPQRLYMVESCDGLLNCLAHNLKKRTQPLLKVKDFYKKIIETKKYDMFFFLGDGSIPFLFSKKNILHIQVPFDTKTNGTQKFSNLFKYKFLDTIVCNSQFTASFIDPSFQDKIKTLYPPVDVNKFSPGPKENIILSVGRFDNILNAKKQDILIDAFSSLIKNFNISNWKLVLAGGSIDDPSKNSYLQLLKENSSGLPVEFLINPDFNSLKEMYSRSKIYWHAAGFGVDQNLQPQNTEHFGISIVEAMASGAVPVVISKGGIPEIVNEGDTGFLWTTTDELVLKTVSLINSPDLIEKIKANSLLACQKFSKENFENHLLNLIL